MTLETLRLEKRSAILDLARLHGATNVRVFGSVARGENTAASDIDFLVDLEPGRNIFDLGELLLDLRDLLSSPVDIVASSCLHPLIRDQVLEDAKPL